MDASLREKNKVLFRELLDFAERGDYSDEYLKHLVDFWQLIPENEADGDIFYAKYALAHQNAKVAIEYGEKALFLRHFNLELWRVLSAAYAKVGNLTRAIFFAALADKFYHEPVNVEIPKAQAEEIMDVFSLGMGRGNYAPMAQERMRLSPEGISHHSEIFAGEFLPELEPQGDYHLWSGAYVEQEMLDYKGLLLEKIKSDSEMADICGADFVFDLTKVKSLGNEATLSLPATGAIVPLMGQEEHQKITFHTEGLETEDYLGKWASSFFRMKGETKLSSEQNILAGEPIPMGHSPKRKKVVINVLLDAFCWRAVRESNYDLAPNIVRFFKKGIIFNNHYSIGEYTYPSFPTIETGMKPYHSQIFNEQLAVPLDRRYKTISERMKELGYYCTNPMSGGEGIYIGVTRGYDRFIVNPYALKTYVGVERAIAQMKAFRDVDQFMLIHTMDTHPWGAHTFQLPLTTQTAFDLKERSMKEEKKTTSVYLPNRPIYHHWNEECIKEADAALKKLFDYLEENYDEDEYLIQLYSDHGVPIYDEVNYIMSAHQTGAAYMLRGAGVPALGFVDELTSIIDIYPSMAKCIGFPVGEYVDGNLPAALGGKEREYTVSLTLYPGIPFMICIRTKEYECRARSHEILDEDGRTDLSQMEIEIYSRASNERVEDDELMAYFRTILDKETHLVDNHGTQWPEMRAARAEWFDARIVDEAEKKRRFYMLG